MGQVNVDLQNNGSLEPGLTVGRLAFGRGLGCGATSVVEFDVAGTAAYDQITVAGTATLGGTLDVAVDAGFTPVYGQTFRIMTAGLVSGEFDQITFAPMQGGRVFVADYTPTTVTLRVDLGCIADWNLDGKINTLDFLAYLNAWASKDPISEITGDGVINTLDFIAFGAILWGLDGPRSVADP
ncbi:MAG: hypothetical protein IPJ41_00340 [Phycisphaerales bacterium]|nr:hypothetical protein [Phycisphaerales bacterium]